MNHAPSSSPQEPSDAIQLLTRLRDRIQLLAPDDTAAHSELEGELFFAIGTPGLTEAQRGGLAEAATLLDMVASGRSAQPERDLAAARACLVEAVGGPGEAQEDAVREPEPEAPVAAAPVATAPPRPEPLAGGGTYIPPESDPELLADFLVEAGEDLDRAEEALMILEGEPGEREPLDTVFRAFHTIKGTSAFLGLSVISELTHHAESLLDRVRCGEVGFGRRVADLCLRSVDLLRSLLDDAGTGRDPHRQVEVHALVADLETACSGTSEAAEAAEAAETAETPAPRASSAARERDAGDGPDEDRAGTAAAAVEASVRVRTDRLDRLIDTVGELVIAQSILSQEPGVARAGSDDLVRKIAHTGKIVRELQDLSMSMRMVPLKATFRKVTRLVRDLAQRSGKRVRLVTEGEDTEIDRSMVDVLGDPLVHMIRNSMDHGIESPEARQAAGKPAEGVVQLRAYHEGGNVVVELRDDGQGLDRARILERARERGIVEPGRTLSDAEICQLIFAPGFSTAETVTDLSGRGVGMDVVRRNIESIRGRIEVRSEPGQGTVILLILPLTLAITDGMLVRVGGERFLIPTLSIEVTFRPERAALSTVNGRGELVTSRGELLPLFRLSRVLDTPGAEQDPARGIAVVISEGGVRFALLVDELLGQQQVVAKSLGQGIGRIEGVASGAILGDGTVGLLLDPVGLQKVARRSGDEGRQGSFAGAEHVAA